MQYALIDNVRTSAFPGGRGKCPLCFADVIAKCGSRLAHHWAHAQKQNCDPWWENETAWHRNWKSLFPEEWREVLHCTCVRCQPSNIMVRAKTFMTG